MSLMTCKVCECVCGVGIEGDLIQIRLNEGAE